MKFNKNVFFEKISLHGSKGWLPSAKLKPTLTFLGREVKVLNMAKSLPRKVKVRFSFALESQPF